MDSGHKDKKIGFHPKSLRPFLRILYVVDDSHIYTHIFSPQHKSTSDKVHEPNSVYLDTKKISTYFPYNKSSSHKIHEATSLYLDK